MDGNRVLDNLATLLIIILLLLLMGIVNLVSEKTQCFKRSDGSTTVRITNDGFPQVGKRIMVIFPGGKTEIYYTDRSGEVTASDVSLFQRSVIVPFFWLPISCN
jgi:hypothetical protein